MPFCLCYIRNERDEQDRIFARDVVCSIPLSAKGCSPGARLGRRHRPTGVGWCGLAQLAAAELPKNIVLLPLPPYAPELNPMENVWEFMRGNDLSHRVWDGYEAIIDACCDGWNKVAAQYNLVA